MNSMFVAHVKLLGAILAAAAFAQTGRTVWEGVYSAPQAARGEALYVERCAACHAGVGAGLDQAPPLAGDEFLAEWNDLTVSDLAERIRLTMPADAPNTLDRAQTADLIAFMLKRNGAKAGDAELPTGADALRAIGFKRPL